MGANEESEKGLGDRDEKWSRPLILVSLARVPRSAFCKTQGECGVRGVLHLPRHAQEDSCGSLRDCSDAGGTLEQESYGGSAVRLEGFIIFPVTGDEGDDLDLDLFFCCCVPQPPPLLLERRLPALWRPAARRRSPRKPATRPALHLSRQAAPHLFARRRHARGRRRRLLFFEGDRSLHSAETLDLGLQGAGNLARGKYVRADSPGRESDEAPPASKPPLRARGRAHREETRRRGLGQRGRRLFEAHGGTEVGVYRRGRTGERQRDGRAR